MDEHLAFRLFATQNTREGTIAELERILSFIQLPRELDKWVLYQKVLAAVRHMTEEEFYGAQSKLCPERDYK